MCIEYHFIVIGRAAHYNMQMTFDIKSSQRLPTIYVHVSE